MPKIIPELREALIAAAKARLTGPEHDAAMRDVAADCKTAVGTVYNYYSSKEELLAAVMLEDWIVTSAALKAASMSAQNVDEGFRAMDAALRGFVDTYRPTWKKNTSGLNAVGEHHAELVKQIGSAVGELLQRTGYCVTDDERTAVAEMLLTLSQRETAVFEKALPIIRKIIS